MRAIVVFALLAGCAGAPPAPEADLEAVRAVFDRNIEAIQQKDKEAYLGCYLPTERLVRAGPKGIEAGYAAMAEGTPATGSDEWPETLEAKQITLKWIRPDLVYGSYVYRVVFDGKATEGVSERVFIRTADGWRIAVTTAFPTAPE